MDNGPSGDTVRHICCHIALWKARCVCVSGVSTVNMKVGDEAQKASVSQWHMKTEYITWQLSTHHASNGRLLRKYYSLVMFDDCIYRRYQQNIRLELLTITVRVEMNDQRASHPVNRNRGDLLHVFFAYLVMDTIILAHWWLSSSDFITSEKSEVQHFKFQH